MSAWLQGRATPAWAVGLVCLAGPLLAQTEGRYAGLEPDVFMRSWLVLGPIPIAPGAEAPPDEAAERKAFDDDLLASCGGETAVALAPGAACTIAGQEYRFRPVESDRDVVDLAKAVGKGDYSVAYAAAEVSRDEAGRILAGLASDDAVKVWVNGTVVHENWVFRAAVEDQDLVSVDLRAGANRVLVKVLNAAGDWSFAARLLGPKGSEEKLWDAARGDDVDSVRRILTAGTGFDVDAPTRWGLTAWQVARAFGSADSAELLAAHGADSKRPLPQPREVVDAMLSEATEGKTPGVAVLVSRDGEVLLEKGYGYADIEREVKVTPGTRFRIGSVTKQFTAAAVLRLQEMGKLAVDDRLSKYFPGYPRGDEVTLHHLLTHTSGIHSYTSRPDFEKRVTEPTDVDDLIRSFRDDPFDFDPGEKWSYSNSGYLLLGRIVEMASGLSYAEFLREQFFGPLGMKDTGVHTRDADLGNEAIGYAQQGDAVQKAPDWDMTWAGGAGALYSTVEDLARWNDAVFGGKVLTGASLAAAFTPAKVGSDPAEDEGYGYGWGIGRLRGVKVVQHNGGLAGFVSALSRYPDERLTVAVLVNAAPPPVALVPEMVERHVAQLYLGDRMEERRTPEAVALSPEALERFVGRYDYGSAVLTVTREGERLFAQLVGQPRFEIFPASENEFFWKVVDARVTFVEEEGRVVKAVHRQGGSTIDAPRLEERPEVALDPEQLDAFVGRYDYGGGKAILTVTREGDHLFAQLVGQPRFEIFPASETEFFWKVVDARVTFVEEEGRVVKAVHRQGGSTIDAPRLEERAEATLSPEQLDAFVGKYDYGGGKAILTVTREGEQLYAQLSGQPRFEIFASGPSEFFWKVVAAKLTFVKDADGKVTGGIHEQGGRRIEVPKIE